MVTPECEHPSRLAACTLVSRRPAPSWGLINVCPVSAWQSWCRPDDQLHTPHLPLRHSWRCCQYTDAGFRQALSPGQAAHASGLLSPPVPWCAETGFVLGSTQAPQRSSTRRLSAILAQFRTRLPPAPASRESPPLPADCDLLAVAAPAADVLCCSLQPLQLVFYGDDVAVEQFQGDCEHPGCAAGPAVFQKYFGEWRSAAFGITGRQRAPCA